MARAGVRALEYYDPTTKKHGQAHMQARYVNLSSRKLAKFTPKKIGDYAASVPCRFSQPR
jgi:hypothetical protein